MNIQFAQDIVQTGQVLDHSLDQVELDLVQSYVNWADPSALSPNLFEIFGRSITFVSPTRFDSRDPFVGEYAGLQVIGAGGSLSFVNPSGMVDTSQRVCVNPVDPTNHAKTLEYLVQLRTVSEEGTFDF